MNLEKFECGLFCLSQNTWGTGELSNGIDIHDNHYLNAQLDIENATEFKVDVSVNGFPGIGSVAMSRFLKLDIFRPRSSALICRKSQNKPTTTHRDIVFGERKHGDSIVYAERNNISATETHLPRHKISFQDNNVVVTAALIRLNVSEYSSILLLFIFTCSSRHIVCMRGTVNIVI